MAFEYGVILNGSQTKDTAKSSPVPFEYGVILNGSQTVTGAVKSVAKFEYGVRKARLNSGFPFIVYSSSNQFS